MGWREDHERAAQQAEMIRFMQASCEGKKRYLKEETAKSHLQAMLREPGIPRKGTLHIYRCVFCKYYHIGHINRHTREMVDKYE